MTPWYPGPHPSLVLGFGEGQDLRQLGPSYPVLFDIFIAAVVLRESQVAQASFEFSV